MTDEEQLAAARGSQAEYELRETEKAFESLRQGFFETIAKTGMEEVELREKCYLAVTIIEGVRQLLVATAAGKVMAESNELIRGILNGEDAG